MATRWLNAVIEIRIPLDVPLDASRDVKLSAVIEAMDQVEMPNSATATCRWELVEDGEPVVD